MRDEWPEWSNLDRRMRRWEHLGGNDHPSGYAELAVRSNQDDVILRSLFWLYSGLSEADFTTVRAYTGRPMPETLKPFYRATNGAHLFDMISLHGLPKGPAYRVYGFGQPVSIQPGNTLERPPYLDDDDYVFGGLIGYSVIGQLVASSAGSIKLVHPANGADVAVTWRSFEEFLFSEFDRLATLHDDHGKFLGTWSDRLPLAAVRWDSPPKKDNLVSRAFSGARNLWRR